MKESFVRFNDYRSVFLVTRANISVIDRRYVYVDANDAFCAELRRDRDSIIGRSMIELWGEDQFARHMQGSLSQCFVGQTVSCKAWYEYPPGERRYYRIDCTPLRDQKGGVTHVMIVATDITDLEHGDAERHQHEQDMSFLYETAIGFVEMPHSDKVCDYLSERLRLLASGVVIVASFDQANNTLRIEHVAGLGAHTGKIYELLGGAPQGRSYPLDKFNLDRLFSGRMIEVQGGLCRLSSGLIDPAVCAAIENMLGVSYSYVMGMASNANLFGVTVVLTPHALPAGRLQLIETCINQTSIAFLRHRVIEELNRSEERMRILFDTSPDAYFLAVDTRIVDANAAFELMSGRKKDELRGRTLAEAGLFNGAEAERLNISFEALFKGIAAHTEEYFINAAGGKKMVVELRMHPVTINGTAHVLGVIRDISDRKRIVEEVRKLAQFVYESPSPMLRVSGAGKLLYATPSSRPLLNQWKSEIDQQLPPEVLEHVRDVLGTNEKKTIEIPSGERIYSFEVVPLTSMNYVNLYGRDITDARRSEEAVRVSEEKYRTLFEESRDVVFISTPANRFIDINQAGVDLFGARSRDELLNIDIAANLYEDPSVAGLLAAKIDEKGYVHDHEIRFKRMDGQVRIVLVTASLVRGPDGTPQAYRGIMRDITESRAMEKQLFQSQKMESLGLLASGVAHDFNNLLTGIMGYSSFLKTKIPREDDLYEGVDIIDEGAKQAAELTQQLLTFARGGIYHIAPTDINMIVRNTLKLIARSIDKLIEVEARLNDAIPLADVDPLQIGQVVMNLCVNARDAMPKGGRLLIETGKETVGGDVVLRYPDAHIGAYVYVSVTDTGKGMSRETISRLFEPFYSTKELGRGTGLGMSVVYGIVKKHGGFITISSELDRGTSIKAYLPATQKPVPAKKAAAAVPARGKGELLLVVDDEAPILTLLKRIGESNGYRVMTAANGVEALDIFRVKHGEIALVLLDVMMPKMDSSDVLRRMQELMPGVKVLLATGNGQGERAKNMVADGAAGIIAKPFNVQEILTRIRTLLDEGQ